MLPFGATFFTFSDYERPAIRLRALQGLPVITEYTHDSIYVGEDGPTHQPIEHLMAALYGLGIDNLVVDLNSEELPIMDGSAKNFVETLEDVGFKISDLPIRIIKINKKVTYLDGEKFITFEPNKKILKIDP